MPSTTRVKARVDKRWRSRSDSSLFLATVLWVVDKLRRPLIWAGIDFGVFREVLRTKFLIELRTGPMGISPNLGNMDFALALTILAFAMLGLLAGLGGVLLPDSPMIWAGGSIAVLMGLLAAMLLTHHVSILVDATDIEVISPHPVPDATLFATRLAHLFVYVGVLSSVYVAAAMLLAVFRQPPLAVLCVYPLACMLAALLVVGATALLFTVILRVFGAAMYQRLALWLQIGVTSFMLAGGQIVPRLRFMEGHVEALASDPRVHAVLPPVHFAGLYMLATGEFTTRNLVYAALALTLPFVALWTTLRLASRHFVAGLSGQVELGPTPKRGFRLGLVSRLGQRLTSSRAERAGFDFACAMATREALFLKMALPQVIGFQVMALAMAWNFSRDDGFGDKIAVPLVMAFLLMGLPQVVAAAGGSKDGSARWLFCASPLETVDEAFRGATKGLVCLGVVLPMIVSATVLLLIFGFGHALGILLAFELTLVAALYFTPGLSLYLPFTFTVGARGRKAPDVRPNFLIVFGLIFAIFGLVLVHVLVTLHVAVTAIAVLALVPLVVSRFRALAKLRLTYELEA